LTQRLHRLRSGGSAGPASSSLATVVELARNRLKPSAPADVKFDLQIEATLPNVAVPSELVLNFMLELLQNAVEACGASGSVTLNASVVELSAERASGLIGRASSGRCVEMQIGDSGSGISPALRDEVIKTPMLTNKPGHWGLGLAIVFRGLYACGAGMALESKTGRGTLARVFLPIA
jgi:nitrogen-specific signal transduction histidine kinase